MPGGLRTRPQLRKDGDHWYTVYLLHIQHIFSPTVLHSTRNTKGATRPIPSSHSHFASSSFIYYSINGLMFAFPHFAMFISIYIFSIYFRFACASQFAFHQRHGPFSIDWVMNAYAYKPTPNTHIDLQTHTGASINTRKSEGISGWSTWTLARKILTQTSPTDNNLGTKARLFRDEIMIINYGPPPGRQLYQGLEQFVKPFKSNFTE